MHHVHQTALAVALHLNHPHIGGYFHHTLPQTENTKANQIPRKIRKTSEGSHSKALKAEPHDKHATQSQFGDPPSACPACGEVTGSRSREKPTGCQVAPFETANHHGQGCSCGRANSAEGHKNADQVTLVGACSLVHGFLHGRRVNQIRPADSKLICIPRPLRA